MQRYGVYHSFAYRQDSLCMSTPRKGSPEERIEYKASDLMPFVKQRFPGKPLRQKSPLYPFVEKSFSFDNRLLYPRGLGAFLIKKRKE